MSSRCLGRLDWPSPVCRSAGCRWTAGRHRRHSVQYRLCCPVVAGSGIASLLLLAGGRALLLLTTLLAALIVFCALLPAALLAAALFSAVGLLLLFLGLLLIVLGRIVLALLLLLLLLLIQVFQGFPDCVGLLRFLGRLSCFPGRWRPRNSARHPGCCWNRRTIPFCPPPVLWDLPGSFLPSC